MMKLRAQIAITNSKRNIETLNASNYNGLSPATFYSYKKHYSLKQRAGQPVFIERSKAIADKRLVCNWVVVVYAAVLENYLDIKNGKHGWNCSRRD